MKTNPKKPTIGPVLRRKLEGISNKNQRAIKNIPFLGHFLEDLIAI